MPEIISKASEGLNTLHKPADCLLLLAFALTQEEFTRDLEAESSKDYAKTVAKRYRLSAPFLWQYHHLPLVNVIKSTAAFVKNLGVTVRLKTTLNDLNDLEKFKVVTIVAHYNDTMDMVELCDRLHKTEELVSNIDNRFSGLFDLSVCNSIFLQDKIKEKFGDDSITRANREPAEIRAHLIMYKNLIELLARFNLNYLTRLIQLRGELINYVQHKLK